MDAELAQEAGHRAHDAVVSMRGATERTVQEVVNHWPVDMSSGQP